MATYYMEHAYSLFNFTLVFSDSLSCICCYNIEIGH